MPFAAWQDPTSAGYQIREAISRFDTNRDGSMSKVELRKALNGLGLSVDEDILESLMRFYQDEDKTSAEYSRFVEDIDPDAFNFAFSAGMCAKSGSFEKMEKEAVVSYLDPPEKIRNSLKVPLCACCGRCVPDLLQLHLHFRLPFHLAHWPGLGWLIAEPPNLCTRMGQGDAESLFKARGNTLKLLVI